VPGNLRKLSLLHTAYSRDFGSCFTFNLLKFKQKYWFKILHEEKLHFLVSFSCKTQFEVHQNDPEQAFEGDTFAQTMAIPQWRALDQTLSNVHSINFTSLGASCGTTIPMQEFKFLVIVPITYFPLPKPWELAHRLKCYTSNWAFYCHQVSVILLPVITIIFSVATHVNINMCHVLYKVYLTIILRNWGEWWLNICQAAKVAR